MGQTRAQSSSFELVRSLPLLLVALLSIVGAVDLFLMWQPALLDEWSHSFRSLLGTRPMLAPATNVLAASLAVACIVIASTVAIVFARAVRAAPHLTIAPAWIAFCMLCAARLHGPFPLPISAPLFIALSALLFVGASALLRWGSRASELFGWLLLVTPLSLFGGSFAYAARGAAAFGADAGLLTAALVLSAVGAVASALTRQREASPYEVPGLEGIDVVAELTAQVDRAEQSEARVAELEKLLGIHAHKQQPPARPRIRERGPTIRLR